MEEKKSVKRKKIVKKGAKTTKLNVQGSWDKTIFKHD